MLSRSLHSLLDRINGPDEFAAFFAFDDYMKAWETTGIIAKCGLATLAGVVLFDDWPQPETLAGAAIVAASSIYILQRESGRRPGRAGPAVGPAQPVPAPAQASQ